jgi:hopene-associated glycosyltransferase HpnB
MFMLILVEALGFAAWLYLVLGHGGFWRVSRLTPPATASDASPVSVPRISVIAVVPARDEADVVGRCVTSLLHQQGVQIKIVLVDDGSSDGTADAARRAAETAAMTEKLTVLAGKPLAAGWSGKLWAVQQGVEHAAGLHPDFYLLTDADIEHAPRSVATLAAIAAGGPYDMASFMVKLYCRSFAERALIPAFVFFFFLLYPPAWIADQRRKTAGAAGGSILIRREALERAGGIAAIRAEVIDDCALAKRVKQSGGRVWLGLAPDTASIRPYGSFAEIGRMISRSAFNQLRHSWLLLACSIAGMALIYAGPPLLLFTHRLVPALLGGAAWLLMALCYLPITRFYRLNPLWSLGLPLVAVFYMGATLHSAVKYSLGRGGEWKDRIQDPFPNKL